MSLITTPGATPDGPLEGRVLMLNTEKAARFQCWGFSVTRNNPIQVVPRQCSELNLRAALAAGTLLDITGQSEIGATGKLISKIDQAIKKGVLSVKEDEETGRAFMGKDDKGNTYVIVPKDEEDYQAKLEELRTTGTIRVPRPKQASFTGLSAIFVEDLPQPAAQE